MIINSLDNDHPVGNSACIIESHQIHASQMLVWPPSYSSVEYATLTASFVTSASSLLADTQSFWLSDPLIVILTIATVCITEISH